MNADNRKRENFEIVSISREDLAWKGYDADNITDDQMRQLAKRMGNAYLDDGFWIDLVLSADYLELPKLEEK